MTDTRDPRGIVNFFVRYLVLHVIFLVGLPLSYAMDLALILTGLSGAKSRP